MTCSITCILFVIKCVLIKLPNAPSSRTLRPLAQSGPSNPFKLSMYTPNMIQWRILLLFRIYLHHHHHRTHIFTLLYAFLCSIILFCEKPSRRPPIKCMIFLTCITYLRHGEIKLQFTVLYVFERTDIARTLRYERHVRKSTAEKDPGMVTANTYKYNHIKSTAFSISKQSVIKEAYEHNDDGADGDGVTASVQV